MTRQEVVSLMESSETPAEWNKNCQIVKDAHGGEYPLYWFEAIIMSGVCDLTLGAGSSTIKIITNEREI